MTQTRMGLEASELLTALSERAGRTEDNPISQMLTRALGNPNLVSLAAGFVDYESLPVDEVREVMAEILADTETARQALQYGLTEGLPSLRQKIAARLRKADGVGEDDRRYAVERLITSTGSQQTLYLISEALLNPGDMVILGHPSYFVFMGALKTAGVQCVPAPLDEEGMRPEVLKEELKRLKQAGQLDRLKMVYVQTYFQNPTGTTVSDRRRDEILSIVQSLGTKHRVYVVEDAAYRELRYDGSDIRSLYSRDQTGETCCYLGTFSKPFSPGLRTGYALLPKSLMKPVVQFKGNHDFGSASLNQYVLDRVMGKGLLDGHLVLLRERYRTKRDAMLQALTSHMPTGCSWTYPQGGLYVYLTLPEGMASGPDSPLFEASLRKGVLYVPGEFCYAQGSGRKVPRNEIRLSFGVGNPDRLVEGVKRLAQAATEVG